MTRTFYADGSIESETNAGRTARFDHDPAFRPLWIQPPGNSQTTYFDYDNEFGAWTKVTRGNSIITTTLDGFGRPVITTNNVGVERHAKYDAEGRTIYHGYAFEPNATTASTDIGTTIEYDALGRVTKEKNPDTTERTRSYDDANNVVTVRDELNRSTILTYQSFGGPDDTRLVGVRDAAGNNWTYQYDSLGALRKVIGPPLNGQAIEREWTYNSQHLLASEKHPEWSALTTYTEYDGAGVLKKKLDPNGTLFTYTYDNNDRLTAIQAGGSTTNFNYETGSDNRIVALVDGQSSTFAYDTTGRLKTRTDTLDGKAFVTSYDYDVYDNLKFIMYPSARRIELVYDNENRVTVVRNPDRNEFYAKGIEYHPSGALSRLVAGNSIVTSLDYDPQRYWVKSITSGDLGLSYQTYDGAGNLKTLVDIRGTTESYGYDDLDRLTSASGPWGPATYTYDAHGNRLTGGGFTYTYDTNNRFRLLSDSRFTLTYDNNGNVRTASQATYTYTPENRLATTTAGSSITSFTYDADDWRVKKATNNGEIHYYVRGPNGALLTDWWNNGPNGQAEVRDYIYAGSRLIAVVKTNQPPK
jgi:YD repeat-containing protein